MARKAHLTLAALCLSLAACQGAKKGDGADQAMFTDSQGLLTVPATSPLRTHLTIQEIAGGDRMRIIDLPAAVEADPARVANILSPLTGRVTALKVALGDRVRRGQVLAVIASGDMAQAYSDAEKARDAADLARKAFERARGVQAAGGSAQKDLEAARSADAQAQAELSRANARLLSLNGATGGHGRDLVLTAPQNGVVTTLSIAPGDQIGDTTATLMTVTNVERVFVTANVPEGDAGQVRPGAEAEIALNAYPGQTLHGHVAEVNALLEPDTRRQKVRVALPNADGRLLPNMFATVRIGVPSAAGVFVPQSALIMNNETTSVLVEVRPWVFQRRAVRIGDETDAAARVLSGLGAGERIVVKGGVLLND
jgi:cobalt-zinc-cadmium efflux system membrane fusion protein